MKLNVDRIDSTHSEFPQALNSTEFFQLWLIGRSDLLNERLVGLFCSAKCPGEVILKTYDVIRAIRDAGVAMIGGFHSPMEKECLQLLLRGEQPVVICPAREVQYMRLPFAWRDAIEAKRALVISPFDSRHRQPTAELSERRNDLVGRLAERFFVPHAEPASKTARLCSQLISHGKVVLTLDTHANDHLLHVGANVVRDDNVVDSLSS
ncbi:MAG: hypothetical protein KatS3mg105_5006 [Gemmatales bacterium]|nr:MAG: hypothetical protein KatS3mg105_5006 [Gemmatales bacterium]